MNGINLRTLNINKISSLSEKNDLSSEDGLVKEYKRLSIQLKQLQILEKRYADQLEQLKSQEEKLMEDMRKFSNFDVGKSIDRAPELRKMITFFDFRR